MSLAPVRRCNYSGGGGSGAAEVNRGVRWRQYQDAHLAQWDAIAGDLGLMRLCAQIEFA